MIDLTNLTIVQAAALLEKGEITSLQLTDAYLERIEKLDSQLNSFITVEPELARAQAKASDERRAAGTSRGQLDGIPYNLKDVYATKESATTAASHMLEGWIAPYNATVYQRLQDAGAVLLGKTNTDEFTMGASSETSYFGVSKNPWDTSRVAGGSSGGPASSMGARLSVFSIGTDTGGSIRQPAAFCGVTGVRPTYGLISRFGEIPMASSLDQTGPLTLTVEDAAIVTEVLAGHDPLDATSHNIAVPQYHKEIEAALASDKPLKGKKIGVAKEYFGEGILPEVEKLTRDGIEKLVELGAEVVELSLPTMPMALAAYYVIAPAEVASNMSRYDGIRYGYSVERNDEKAHPLFDVYAKSRSQGIGSEVKRRIMMGNYVLSAGYVDAYYKQAEKVRQKVRQEFTEAFSKVDLLVAPTSPHVAFTIGANDADPLAMYKEDVLTVPLNIAGIPGLSVPCGMVNNLPVGLQLMSDTFKESEIFIAGAAFQKITNFHTQTPPIAS